jgi:hypothetical protein
MDGIEAMATLRQGLADHLVIALGLIAVSVVALVGARFLAWVGDWIGQVTAQAVERDLPVSDGEHPDYADW